MYHHFFNIGKLVLIKNSTGYKLGDQFSVVIKLLTNKHIALNYKISIIGNTIFKYSCEKLQIIVRN